MKVALLGPQRFDPSVAEAAMAAGVTGRFALITAGWQEREREDDELSEHLGGRTVNLALHERADDVFRSDGELRGAYRARQLRFRQLQDFYRIRLEHLIESARVIAHRAAPTELLAQEQEWSVNGIRVLDKHHLRQCERVRTEFQKEWAPLSRGRVAWHRAELARLLEGCDAVAIAGGHVASLLNRLQLFGVTDLIGERPVFAWSAGAMAVTERIVLFHDDPPYGVDAPQVLEPGLGLVSDVVALPNPEARLALDDAERMAMYAQRFAPATCMVLPRRSWVLFEAGAVVGSQRALTLHADGAVADPEAA